MEDTFNMRSYIPCCSPASSAHLGGAGGGAGGDLGLKPLHCAGRRNVAQPGRKGEGGVKWHSRDCEV